MKKNHWFLTILAIVLSFGACSNDSPNSNSDSLLEYSSEGLFYDIDGEEVTIVAYRDPPE